MKVSSHTVGLASSHAESRRLKVSERIEQWSGPPPDSSARVELSGQGQAALQADAASATPELEDAFRDDARLTLLVMLIEKITGRPVRFMRASDLPALADAKSASAAAEPGAPAAAEWGMIRETRTEYSEQESTRFAARGTVRTADGRSIEFDLQIDMSRSFSMSTSDTLREGNARLKDPLMLDFAGPASALSDQRFAFDLDADGVKDAVPLPSGRGMLAFDRNGNGRVDDGRELFGPLSGDGFAELAALDDDGNGWLDEADAAFGRLMVWQPDASGAGTLTSLSRAGIGAFYLGRVDTPFSVRNAANDTLGEVRATSVYLNEDGSAGTVSQVDLSV
ncbi:hypothetical protein [Methyloversatilis thermotolerans]|uniref:hypothetical protein n=1 Tax=Methyloversatilis thermotolerans TaxID=1346290 RepID=UPI0003A51407|nr:hypothetical protein [Methyloversatilis thermotolerans]